MNLATAVRFLAVLVASAAATALCAWLAPRLGWTDAPDSTRKRQGRPVPAVGGVAVLAALAAVPGAWPEADRAALWGPWLPSFGWWVGTLVLAFLVGTWDDRSPLAAGRKAMCQLVALAPLGVGAEREHGFLAALALVLLAAALLNLLNTFDNADGALTGLCALGFAAAAPLVSAACLGFLPFNLDAARRSNRASAAPSAYLGDAGAFVLALFVLWIPASAGLVLVPALDLLRLAGARWRAGSRPWIGDRRHLAHRLEARGLPRAVVAATQCVLALPACLGLERALARGSATPALLGLGLGATLYGLALRAAPERPEVRGDGPALPCPPGDRSE